MFVPMSCIRLWYLARGVKHNWLEDPFLRLNIMFRLNKGGRLETIENHFYLKDYGTMSNPGGN